MKKNESIQKTSLYVDKDVFKAIEKLVGPGRVSHYIREILKKITIENYVVVKVSEETKKVVDVASKMPATNNILETTMETAIAKSVASIKSQLKKELIKVLD